MAGENDMCIVCNGVTGRAEEHTVAEFLSFCIHGAVPASGTWGGSLGLSGFYFKGKEPQNEEDGAPVLDADTPAEHGDVIKQQSECPRRPSNRRGA